MCSISDTWLFCKMCDCEEGNGMGRCAAIRVGEYVVGLEW